VSTRITIAYDDKYHLYSECFDENNSVYLELGGPELEYSCSPGELTVRIPRNVIEAILNNSAEIRERFDSGDWNFTEVPQEWKKKE